MCVVELRVFVEVGVFVLEVGGCGPCLVFTVWE